MLNTIYYICVDVVVFYKNSIFDVGGDILGDTVLANVVAVVGVDHLAPGVAKVAAYFVGVVVFHGFMISRRFG